MKKYSAVLFDMDGLLLDTEQVYTDVTQAIMDEWSKQYTWEIKQHCIGRGSQESADYICQTLDVPIDGAEYLRRREPMLRECFQQVLPKPGARELVEKLAKMGVPMALATSSNHEMFKLKTQHHEWFSHFGALITSSHPDVSRAKPAPDIFSVAAKEIGVLIDNCLVFEDSPAGLEAAIAAGAGCICVPDPNMDKSHYAAANLVLDSLEGFVVEDWL